MEIEIIWVEGKNRWGDPTWTWTISGRKSYEITKRRLYGLYGLGLYGLGLHPTLDKTKDYAVKHFLKTNPEMTLSEERTKIVPHAKSEQLTQPGQNQTESPGPEKQKQVDSERKMKYVDHSETEPAASAGVPQNEQADLQDRRRVTSSPSPPTSLHGGDANVISPFESSLSLNEANTTGNPMITHKMFIAEVLDLLGKHGCPDLTDKLDTSNLSEHPISSGGYGDVYRGAFHNGTAVAVKCLRLHEDSSEATKKQLKRAARELYVWSKCDHPNVLGLIGVAQYRGQIAMVSPWMERGSLKRLLLQQAEVDRYTMCAQITDGVAYMHSKNMVHGDLKCDNILVSSNLTPKLTDFGNASLKEYTLQFTNTTSSVGVSLNWAAPEMLDEEQNNPTMESDVYSLGMTILETITGEAPYTGISQQRIYVKKVVKKVLPTRPEAYLPLHSRHANLLWSLVENCCAFTPEDRPNAGEVQERMKEVMMARGSGNLS